MAHKCMWCDLLFDDAHAKYTHMVGCPQRGVRWN